MRDAPPYSTAANMTKFARVSEADWVIARSIESGRIRRIRQAENFEAVVLRIVRDAWIERLSRERARTDHSAFRLIVHLRVKPQSLDEFFNSPVGYRAQYLVSCKLGEEANRFVINELLSKVLEERKQGKRLKQDFIRNSLKDPACKVWPHQGQWLRQAKREDRVLLVPRWQAECVSGDKARQKLARWGSLAPAHETRLPLKGGFIGSTSRVEINKSLTNRSRELHELGFT